MIGIAQGAFDTTLPYLFQRKQFGQLIGDMQVGRRVELSGQAGVWVAGEV